MTGSTKQLSIIIVSWNTAELLVDCLASLYHHAPTRSFDVWVVDNASTDDSVERIRQAFPQVHVLANEKNVGFANANNQAIEQSDGRYVFLLNPDTRVLPDAIDELWQFLEAHPDTGAVGSMLLNEDGSLQPSCYPAPTLSRELWRLFHMDRIRPYGEYWMADWPADQPREVDILMGASFMVRRDVLDAVGFLDGGYFMFSEEVDLCYRIQKAGWRIFWVPRSRILHYGGQSTKLMKADMFVELYRGKLYYFRKNYGKRAGVAYKFILALASLARLALVPLTRLQKPPNRDRNLILADRYRRLLVSLPGM